MARAPNPRPSLRVGLFGGSFNPPHLGHLHVAEQVKNHLNLDEIWLLPVPLNTLKTGDDMATFAQRLRWCQILAEPYPWLQVSDIEQQVGTNETIDTVRFLQQHNPTIQFTWIMGQDSFLSIEEWGPSRLFMAEIATVIVPRNTPLSTADLSKISQEIKDLERDVSAGDTTGWQMLPIATHPGSATAIRNTWRQGKKPDHLTDTVYAEMIRADNLYANP